MGFGTDVLDARSLHDRTDGTAGNDARTFGSREHEHAAPAELSDHLVRDGRIDQAHVDHLALCLRGGLLDCLRHLAGLAAAHAHLAVAVADDDQGREAHMASALDDLGDAVDRYQLFDEVVLFLSVSAISSIFTLCHCLVPSFRTLSRRLWRLPPLPALFRYRDSRLCRIRRSRSPCRALSWRRFRR